jgi:hypothetical protein
MEAGLKIGINGGIIEKESTGILNPEHVPQAKKGEQSPPQSLSC